jgi:hypothetical protein
MKRGSKVVIVCAAAALVAALLAGCGQTNTLSRSEWVTAADGYCASANEANATTEAEFEALFQRGLTTPAERAKAAELVRAGIPNVESEASNLEISKPPPAAEEREKSVIAGFEKKAALEGHYADALESGSAAELEAVTNQLARNNAALERLADELEMKVCGRPEPESE